MKHFILFLITTLIFISSFAQNNTRTIDWEWAPIGAVWMYETANMGMKDEYAQYWYVRSVKDTVYNEVNCRKLEVIRHYYPDFEPVKMSNRFTYQNEGDIYFYNADIDEFVLSFSYDLEQNDTVVFTMPIGEHCSHLFHLDTVLNWNSGFLSGAQFSFIPYGIFLYTNTPLSSYKLQYDGSNDPPYQCHWSSLGLPYPYIETHDSGRYLDYCGPRSDIFFDAILDELVDHFNCYCDGAININSAYVYLEDTIIYAEDSCINYYNQFNSILSDQKEEKLKVYPNPVTNDLHISQPCEGNYSVKIISIEGQCLLHETELYETAKINLKHLESGIYIIYVKTKSKVYTKKILKI